MEGGSTSWKSRVVHRVLGWSGDSHLDNLVQFESRVNDGVKVLRGGEK
jgi:hypothetical protein